MTPESPLRHELPYRLAFWGLCGCACFLLFYGLGRGAMSLDESLAANLSWNTLQFGYPKTWDGRNFISLHNGSEFNGACVWVLHPWLSFYLKVPALLAFGKTTWGIRVTLALFGLLSLLMVHRLALGISGNRAFALLSLACAVFSVPLLLLYRQGHYYALAAFLMLVSIDSYLRFLRDRGQWPYALLGISWVLLFYTNTIYLMPVAGGMVLHYLLFEARRATGRENLGFALLPVFTFLLASPWIVAVLLPLSRSIPVVNGFNHGLAGFGANILGLVWKLQTYSFPFMTLALIWAAAAFLTAGPRTGPAAASMQPAGGLSSSSVWLLLFIIGLNILSASLQWKHPWLPYRYLLAGIVLGPVLGAHFLWSIIARQTILGLGLIPLILGTNLLHIFPYTLLNYLKLPSRSLAWAVKSPRTTWLADDNLYGYLTYFHMPESYLGNFLGEITSSQVERTEAIVAYLNRHAAPEDVVLVETVEADNVIFYTGLRVADRLTYPNIDSFLSIRTLYAWGDENARRFDSWNRYPPERIKWIIASNYCPPSGFRQSHKADYLAVELQGADYFLNPLQDLDMDRILPWEQRPHKFAIYMRKSDPSGAKTGQGVNTVSRGKGIPASPAPVLKHNAPASGGHPAQPGPLPQKES